MSQPSNRDLEIMLTYIKAQQESVIEKLGDIKAWQRDHQENDSKQFKELNLNINKIYGYCASIGGLGALIGASGAYIWKRLTGAL